MQMLLSELPEGTEYGQLLCYVRHDIPMSLLKLILVSPEDQAAFMWPRAGEQGWIEGPLYREGPIESFYPPIGRPIALYGIARKTTGQPAKKEEK